MKKRSTAAQLMDKGIDAFDQVATSTDRVAKVAGVAAGVAAPTVAVGTTAAVTGVSGGAAILKTLAVAGGIVGGGAVAGITVIGVGAVAVGWGTWKLVRYFRRSKPTLGEKRLGK